jgi:hypothetical protein
MTTITEVDLDAGGNVVVFDRLSPISIGVRSLIDVWGLTQDGQAYFDRDGPAPGEYARICDDGLGGLVVEAVTSWVPPT